jgi:hypothetical protein
MEVFCDHPTCDKSWYGNGSWQECMAGAKAKGWSVRKADGAWRHFCPLHGGLEVH